MMIRKEECRVLGASVLIAALLLLLFSRCSPLYPTNSWGEANAFFTVGRGMLAGKVPYRDMELGAGPVVYALHAIGACISPVGFLGIWLIEIAALAGLIFFSWKMAVRISGMPVLSVVGVALMGLLLVSSRAFIFGDTVEEFALPLQAWAMCGLLEYLDDFERRMSTQRLVLHGFLAGCVFWLKYSLLGVHLVFIAVIAIDAMVREREMKGAIWMCLEFAAGAVFATAPWVLYFGLNDALKVFLRSYFNIDPMALLESFSPLRDAVAGLASGVLRNPSAAVALLCGVGYMLRWLVRRRWNVKCTVVVSAFVCAVLLAYMEGERYRFSPMAIGVFLMMCAGPVALLARYAWRQKRAYGVLLAGAVVVCVGYGCVVNENLPYIGYSRDGLPQTVFAKIIEEEGGGEVLTYRIGDKGFYLSTETLPGISAFADCGAYEISDDSWYRQYKTLKAQPVEWVISCERDVPMSGYTQVATASSPYDHSTVPGQGAWEYYLYRLTYWDEAIEK